MLRDIGKFTIHFNRYYLSNFSLGIDYYYLVEYEETNRIAIILQLNFLFFNITITKWTGQLS